VGKERVPIIGVVYVMKAKIVSCDDSRKWYSHKIGQSFPVVSCGDIETYVKTHDSYNTGNFISNCDLEIEYEKEESNPTPS
jgi:hypothetical protein